jgi:hypothetical protein
MGAGGMLEEEARRHPVVIRSAAENKELTDIFYLILKELGLALDDVMVTAEEWVSIFSTKPGFLYKIYFIYSDYSADSIHDN